MERLGSTTERSHSRSSRSTVGQPHGRDADLNERRRRWMEQQEREREHERLKRKKIEEYERKRRAEEEARSGKGRSSYRSRSRSADRSGRSNKKADSQSGATKPTVMSEKFESSSNITRFKGSEGTKIDIAELRRIKVDIHRNITAAESDAELQRDIVDAEDVKLKRREGEGAKPIFERKELKTIVTATEVEEHRTVVAVDSDKTDRRFHSTRKRSPSPTISRRKYDDNSRSNNDVRSSRRENFKQNFERSETRRSPKHESERRCSRDRSREHRESYKRADSRDRRSPRRTDRHDVSRDHGNRRNRSNSRDRESRRIEIRNRSSRDRDSRRETRVRDDFRETRIRDNRSRERTMAMSHHYADTVPFPMYYEGFHPRPIMVGPMMPMSTPMPMGRGRIPPMMGPMRPIFPPRFIPPDMFRPGLNPNPRFNRMY